MKPKPIIWPWSALVVMMIAIPICPRDAQAGIESAKVKSVVRLDSSRQVYRYLYTLINPSSNADPIDNLGLDITTKSQTCNCDSISLRWEDTTTAKRIRGEISNAGGTLLNISASSVPPWWTADISVRGRIEWFTGNPYLLQPGAASIQFETESKCLPGIRDGSIYAYFNVYAYPSPDDMPTPEEADSLMALLDSLQNTPGKNIRVVGPVTTPSPFVALIFLDSLKAYVAASRGLSWITTQPIADKYTHYFDTTRARLKNADIKGAIVTLQTVLTQVNLDSSTTLTSEAYALLRYNTEYFISRLRQGTK
jgi:hypothetical protein